MTLRKLVTRLVRPSEFSKKFKSILKQMENTFLKTDEQKIDIGLNFIEKVKDSQD